MKLLIAFSLLPAMALSQAPGKVITFNKSDTEHCKIVIAAGKPLLQSTFEDTSVAIAMPLNRGNGDFSIFVRVSRTGSGAVEVNPKNFYGVFSDKDHTRFHFYDTATAIEMAHPQGAGAAFSSANVQLETPPTKNPPVGGKAPMSEVDSGNGGPPSTVSPNMSAVFFPKAKIKPGSAVAGWVTLRQSSGGKLEVHPTDMLDEVDIVVGGVLFRF